GARVKVFGVVGEGNKFVYVFDRSLSMGEDDRIGFARRELIGSLRSLESTHQFQIIFYNHKPYLFQPSGGRGRLSFGTEENKTAAAKFVQSITAAGATNHEKALQMAVNLRPDVIFFLTDAGDGLTGGQLQRIRRLNGGHASINAILFDVGAYDGSANFSERLAHQNGGSFSYVDVSKLRRGR
ncbi:MAG: VWA domain-containing protein, partial [Planctomycetes bacterium]|nr:VWA domain-containing protein [Planctomycetota bacterium]